MNGKWTYIESETLGQTIAFDEISGWIICKDGTRYSPAELREIRGVALPLSVHLLKKEFGGTIVSVTEKPPRGGLISPRQKRTRTKNWESTSTATKTAS